MSDGIRVRVLESATFNGPDHKALPWAEEGDYITIAGGDYAQWLRENGLVVFANTEEERQSVEQQIADLEAHMQALSAEKDALESFETEEKEPVEEDAEQDGSEESVEGDEAGEGDAQSDPPKTTAKPGRKPVAKKSGK